MRLAILLAAALAGCLKSTEFHCTTSDQCGPGGTCQSAGFCSSADSTCNSGQRFGDSAGGLAGQCVGATSDGGIADAPIDAPGSGSATTDCGTGYVSIAAFPGHQYLVTPAQSWNSAQAACMRTSPLTYLTIPDVAAEVSAYQTLIPTGSFWIGISDNGTPETVFNSTPPYVNWAPGQPSTTANNHCVDVAADGANAGQFTVDRCSNALPAICECEP